MNNSNGNSYAQLHGSVHASSAGNSLYNQKYISNGGAGGYSNNGTMYSNGLSGALSDGEYTPSSRSNKLVGFNYGGGGGGGNDGPM